MLIKLQIFISKQGNDTLIEVLLERYDNFDIYWYHWPKDGLAFWVEDYEPVIIIYKGDQLCYLVTRRHWRYQPYSAEVLKIPVEVLFEDEYHPPHPKTEENGEWFERKKGDLIQGDYSFREINANEIPEMFRIGKNHPTSLGRRVKDPIEKAKEIYEENCKDDI